MKREKERKKKAEQERCLLFAGRVQQGSALTKQEKNAMKVLTSIGNILRLAK